MQLQYNGRQYLVTGSYGLTPDIKVRLDEIREVSTWVDRDTPVRYGFVYRPNPETSIVTRGPIPNLDEAERILREAAMRVLMAQESVPISVRGHKWRNAIAASVIGALTFSAGVAATPQSRTQLMNLLIWTGDQIIEKIWAKSGPAAAANAIAHPRRAAAEEG